MGSSVLRLGGCGGVCFVFVGLCGVFVQVPLHLLLYVQVQSWRRVGVLRFPVVEDP